VLLAVLLALWLGVIVSDAVMPAVLLPL
jgi:hypothetical protein